jgi:hypothetical protein
MIIIQNTAYKLNLKSNPIHKIFFQFRRITVVAVTLGLGLAPSSTAGFDGTDESGQSN